MVVVTDLIQKYLDKWELFEAVGLRSELGQDSIDDVSPGIFDGLVIPLVRTTSQRRACGLSSGRYWRSVKLQLVQPQRPRPTYKRQHGKCDFVHHPVLTIT
jgi:hypothetical protein